MRRLWPTSFSSGFKVIYAVPSLIKESMRISRYVRPMILREKPHCTPKIVDNVVQSTQCHK
jgi:hypothetical protein